MTIRQKTRIRRQNVELQRKTEALRVAQEMIRTGDHGTALRIIERALSPGGCRLNHQLSTFLEIQEPLKTWRVNNQLGLHEEAAEATNYFVEELYKLAEDLLFAEHVRS